MMLDRAAADPDFFAFGGNTRRRPVSDVPSAVSRSPAGGAMAQAYVLKSFSCVFYSVKYTVGGPHVGGDHTDVMLLQYLLNRYHQKYVNPYGGKRPLVLDGVIGERTHYHLLHFILKNFGAESKIDVGDYPHCTTYINPIENVHTGASPAEVMIASPMGRLMFNAFLGQLPRPSFDATQRPSQYCPPDVPPELVRALENNVSVF
jgi:hypothetical protein